jgi:uncharacterized protein
MSCPDCGKGLAPKAYNEIEINECVNCGGKWFERGQLKSAKDNENENMSWLDFDPFGKDAEALSIQSEGKQCPNCSKKMSSLKYSKSNIIIDKCMHCEGVWLDSGEFPKIIEYIENVINTESARDYSIDTFNQFIKVITGSESVGSEIKDLMALVKLLEMRIAAEHPKLANTLQAIYKNIPFK